MSSFETAGSNPSSPRRFQTGTGGQGMRCFNNQIHDKDGERFYYACGKSIWEQESSTQRNQYLHVRGIRVGSILHMGKFELNRFKNVIPVLNDIPTVYTNFRLSEPKEYDSIIGESQEMPSSLVQALSELTIPGREASQVNALEIRPTASNEKQVIDIWPQTRFEALWRTLIADAWNCEHPAPREAGYAFVHSLVSSMMGSLKRAQRIQLSKEGMIHPGGAAGLVLDLANAAIEGVQSEERLALEWGEYISGLMALQKDEMTSIQHLFERDPYSLNGPIPMPCLPQIKTSEDIVSFDLDEQQARLWDGHEWNRYLFSTETHKIGLSPKTIMAGDEIWILRGAGYPFILRPLENGRYRLVGESYVHGLMHGEAIILGKDISFQDLVLK